MEQLNQNLIIAECLNKANQDALKSVLKAETNKNLQQKLYENAANEKRIAVAEAKQRTDTATKSKVDARNKEEISRIAYAKLYDAKAKAEKALQQLESIHASVNKEVSHFAEIGEEAEGAAVSAKTAADLAKTAAQCAAESDLRVLTTTAATDTAMNNLLQMQFELELAMDTGFALNEKISSIVGILRGGKIFHLIVGLLFSYSLLSLLRRVCYGGLPD